MNLVDLIETHLSDDVIGKLSSLIGAGELIDHPGSRAQHLQNRYRHLNDGAQWQAPRTVAIFRVFSGDFAVRIQGRTSTPLPRPEVRKAE